MDDTSLSLLERLQHHPSESAWRDLVELYTPLLDDWLTRFKLQGADREDLVQESLTTVLPHVANFRHHGQGTYNSPHEADMVTAESAHPSAEKLNAFAWDGSMARRPPISSGRGHFSWIFPVPCPPGPRRL